MSTLASPGTAPSSPRELAPAGIAKGAFGGAVIGAIGNLALFGLATAISGPLTAKYDPNGPVAALPAVQVAVASIVPAVVATLFTLALNAFTSRPSRILTIVAAVFTTVSMMGPINLPEASGMTKLALGLMHVVSGVAITAGILKLGKR
jgi:hypothetical protein